MRSTGKHGSWWESPSGKRGIKALPAQGAGGAWRREPDWGLGLFVRGKPRQNVLFVHDITRVRIVVLRGVNDVLALPYGSVSFATGRRLTREGKHCSTSSKTVTGSGTRFTEKMPHSQAFSTSLTRRCMG